MIFNLIFGYAFCKREPPVVEEEEPDIDFTKKDIKLLQKLQKDVASNMNNIQKIEREIGKIGSFSKEKMLKSDKPWDVQKINFD